MKEPLTSRPVEDTKFDVRVMQGILGSPAWTEQIRPLLEARLDGVKRRLRDRSDERKKQMPDDYLYGKLDELEFLLLGPQDMVTRAIEQLHEDLLARSKDADVPW